MTFSKHTVKDYFSLRTRLASCGQFPWPAALIRVVPDHVRGLFFAVQVENDELREDRDRLIHSSDYLCFLSDTLWQQGGRPEQINHIFLGHNDRTGGMVEVRGDLAIHSSQKAFEHKDQHDSQGHPGNAQSQTSLVLKEITPRKGHDPSRFGVR